MTRFRPCIDLHDGRVKQIVGGSLSDDARPRENFVSDMPADWYADRYARDGLTGGHVIQLGNGNEAAATAALAAYPGGLQIGGGITVENASTWLDRGASHVIVTSSIFDQDWRFSEPKLSALVREVGADRLVLDLSCKRTSDGWRVAMNRWQTLTDLEVTTQVLDGLAASCAEFLVHAVDVEGKCEGIDRELAAFLGGWGKLPLTYAGGIRSLQDLWEIEQLSEGRMDATIGSTLDMFGGTQVRYADCLRFNSAPSKKEQLRVVMRSQLRALPLETVKADSALLVDRLVKIIDELPSRGGVAIFGGLTGEPLLLELLEHLVARGVPTAFMDFADGEMFPKLVRGAGELVKGQFGVLVPDQHCPHVDPASLACVLTPGLAFDETTGLRLGRGKGHYDRFFERSPSALRLGVCWESQILHDVPGEAHDVRMHGLVTPDRYVQF